MMQAARTNNSATLLWGFIAAIAVMLIPFSHDPVLALYAWTVLVIAFVLLGRVYGPLILLMVAGLQYCQAAAILVQGAVMGVPVTQLPENGPWIEGTTYFALTGILMLTIGMRLGSGGTLKRSAAPHVLEEDISPEAALRLYLLAYGAAMLFAVVGRFGGSAASQLVLHAGGIRWIGLFVLFYASLRPGGRPAYAVAALLFEIAVGLTGFFASFKEAFYVAFLAVMVSGVRLNFSRLVTLLLLGSILVTLMAFWSAIKIDYRRFLNRGSGEQVIAQTVSDRVDYLLDRVENVDGQVMSYGFSRLLDRVSYVYYLGRTMQTVPEGIPHEDGALLGAAIMHILTPRLIFPDKPPLPSDSVITAKYANMGSYYARGAGSTSISIGYLGELYIDFGVTGALVGVFVLGLIYGRIHRALCGYTLLPAYLNYGVSIMVLLNAVQFEQALIKTLGSVFASLAIALVLRRFALPWILVFATKIDAMVRDQFDRKAV